MKAVTNAFCIAAIIMLTMCKPSRVARPEVSQIDKCASELKQYAQQKGYSTKYCLLIDMSLNSGLKRFFIYDLAKNTFAHLKNTKRRASAFRCIGVSDFF